MNQTIMQFVIVFDADNTLWDTNEVFLGAQLDLLRVYQEGGLIASAESEVSTLREIDRALISRIGNFEYDFGKLAFALNEYFSNNLTINEVADLALQKNALQENSPLTREAHRAFVNGLSRIPRLDDNIPGLLHVLRRLLSKTSELVLVLFSDGNPERLSRILVTHHLDKGVFDEIVISSKCLASFQKVKETALKHLSKLVRNSPPIFIMVGDSLQRDIAFANQTGFTTIYKPAGFFGEEAVTGPHQKPDFRITSLDQLPELFKRWMPKQQIAVTT